MSDPAKLSRRYATLVVASMSVIVLTCIALLVPVPYVRESPGEPFDTLGMFDGEPTISFGSDVKTYDASGALYFTTVQVTRPDSRLSLGEAVKAYFDSDVALVPRSMVYPEDTTAEQSSAESAAQLAGSKDTSRVAALRAAGYEVTGRPRVAAVDEDGPSAEVLERGYVVLRVDGTPVTTPDATVKAITAHDPGDTIRLTVERKGRTREVSVVARADEDDPKIPRIGIAIDTKYRFPIKIDNNVGSRIGGPSAGAMFALAIYDRLTPGSLTGGAKVAGTGTIDVDGVIGPIGGVRQKMAGAAAGGAEIFLVPEANCAEAADGDDEGLTLVRVDRLDDAISSLKALADDPEAEVPTCS